MRNSPMKLPFMSIVVICYNGAATIGRALQSILTQDYPKDKFEIVVVDDGSTDDTAAVVSQYPVRYVYQQNGGISRARNAGLEVVTGDVYVAFDDDCVAEKGWLVGLARGYAAGNPAGVGGFIGSSHAPRGLLQHYMDASGGGPAPVGGHEGPKSVLGRIAAYWLANFKRVKQVAQTDIFEVGELYGANGSFPVAVLKKVGGWSPEMSGIEDRAISQAIRTEFPDRPFFAVPGARITHEPEISLLGYLKRPWKRGPVNWQFHRQNSIVPPLFPLPFIFGLTVIVTLALRWQWSVPEILLLPQLLYLWWPLTGLRRIEPLCFFYPYLQLAEETMVIAGLMRGAAQEFRRRHVQTA